jgi:hypothetical protein
MECNLSRGYNYANLMLYGEANRCRLPLLPITENVFGGNGIQRAQNNGSF